MHTLLPRRADGGIRFPRGSPDRCPIRMSISARTVLKLCQTCLMSRMRKLSHRWRPDGCSWLVKLKQLLPCWRRVPLMAFAFRRASTTVMSRPHANGNSHYASVSPSIPALCQDSGIEGKSAASRAHFISFTVA